MRSVSLLHTQLLKSFLWVGVLSLLSCSSGSLNDIFSKGDAPDNVVRTVEVSGTALDFRIFVPKDPEEGMPLLVAFHGGGGRDFAFPQQSAFEALAERERFLIAYPLADLQDGNEGEWELNTTAESRDIRFVRAVVDDMAETFGIDRNRVYGTGYSLGSMFIYEVACQLDDTFSGVASFAGSMPLQHGACEPAEQMGIMHLHDRDDGIIPYETEWDWKAWDKVGRMSDIPSMVEMWGERYECTEADRPDDNIFFSNCDGDVRVEHQRLTGSGHLWPEKVGGVSTHQVIWDFVSQFRKREE